MEDKEKIDGEMWNDRTLRLLGSERVDTLARAKVLVVGVGGVGGYAAEMLVRAGVGHIVIVDADDVSVSNVNRQLIALHSTIACSKVELFSDRFHDINPDVDVVPLKEFISPDNISTFFDRYGDFDYVVDAIDTLAPKVALINHCLRNHVRIISSMGAGGRTDVSKIIYSDLWATRDDGLARAVRQRLKKSGVKASLLTVCSTEAPHTASLIEIDTPGKRTSYGTLCTIPAVFGIYLANYVINALTK